MENPNEKQNQLAWFIDLRDQFKAGDMESVEQAIDAAIKNLKAQIEQEQRDNRKRIFRGR